MAQPRTDAWVSPNLTTGAQGFAFNDHYNKVSGRFGEFPAMNIAEHHDGALVVVSYGQETIVSTYPEHCPSHPGSAMWDGETL